MEFSPFNKVVQYCLRGMEMENSQNPSEAIQLFQRAWNEAANDFEHYLAAHYIARHQDMISDRLHWLEKALHFGQQTNNVAVMSAFPTLYQHIAQCYEALGDEDKAKENLALANSCTQHPADKGPFYHGTKADLQVGDLLTAGGHSNYKTDLKMNHIYFTALPNGAGLAAALAAGDGRERVYIVEPTGSFENDPNLTDKKFPGNPSRSYRSASALKIIGELTDWKRQTPEELQRFREKLANNKGEIIN